MIPDNQVSGKAGEPHYAGVATAMVVLFFAAGTQVDRPTDFDSAYEKQPLIAVYLTLFYLTILTTAATVVYWSFRWSRGASAATAWGLRLLAIGLLSALFFSVTKIVALVGGWFDIDLSYLSTVLAPVLGTAGMPICVVGMVLPALDSRVRSRVARLRLAVGAYIADLKAYGQLEPLWSALQPVDPRLVHRPRGLRQRSTLRIRLFWRIIEIRDWEWKLRPYAHPDAADIAARHCREADLDPETTLATIEAVQIRAALAAQSKQTTFHEDAPSTSEIPSTIAHLALAIERERLTRVGRLYHRSVVVDRALAELSAVPSL